MCFFGHFPTPPLPSPMPMPSPPLPSPHPRDCACRRWVGPATSMTRASQGPVGRIVMTMVGIWGTRQARQARQASQARQRRSTGSEARRRKGHHRHVVKQPERQRAHLARQRARQGRSRGHISRRGAGHQALQQARQQMARRQMARRPQERRRQERRQRGRRGGGRRRRGKGTASRKDLWVGAPAPGMLSSLRQSIPQPRSSRPWRAPALKKPRQPRWPQTLRRPRPMPSSSMHRTRQRRTMRLSSWRSSRRKCFHR